MTSTLIVEDGRAGPEIVKQIGRFCTMLNRKP
jgi:hypothetical protein